MREPIRNPRWTNTALAKQWKDIESLVGPAMMPVVSSRTARSLTVVEYGTGHYGTVMPTHAPGIVAKVTSDISEARFVAAALKIGEFPPGIVRYHNIYALDSSYRKRPLFILWREEAQDVGWIFHNITDPNERHEIQQFLSRLTTVQNFGSTVVSYISKTKAKDAKDQLEHWFEYYRGDISGGNVQLAARALRLKGAQRAGFSLAVAEFELQMMSSEPQGYLVGEAMLEYLNEGMFLADVHAGNIGRAMRERSLAIVITDPGHAVFLDERYKGTIVPFVSSAVKAA